MKAVPSNLAVLLVMISQGVWLDFTVNHQKVEMYKCQQITLDACTVIL